MNICGQSLTRGTRYNLRRAFIAHTLCPSTTLQTSTSSCGLYNSTRSVATSHATSSSNNREVHTYNPPPPPRASSHKEEDDFEIPPPPTDCCMSGCANCVWVTYAEELAQIYKDGGKASERVLEAIEDPSLKIFLSLELKEKLKS